MPRVLIAGCGYLGSAAARLFLERSWDVRGWVGTDRPNELRFPVDAVDISDPTDVRQHADDYDFVVQAVSTRGGDATDYRGVYLEGARHLCQSFPESTILFTSSTSVYGQTAGEWVTEESETNPPRETGRVLLEAERVVLEHGGVVARLGGIYGPGRSALLDRFLRSNGQIEPEQDRYVNAIHRDDAALAYLALLEHAASGSGNRIRAERAGIYNVVDDEPILLSDAFRFLAGCIDPSAGERAAAFSRRRGGTNKRVSNAKLRAMGWFPRFRTLREGMRDSVLPERGLAQS